MSREDDIAAALADHVRQQVEAAEQAAMAHTDRSAKAGALHSSGHLRALAQSYRDSMRDLAERAARLLVAFEEEAAENSAHLLDNALRDASAELTEAYGKRTSVNGAFGSMANEAARSGAWLVNELDLIVTGTVRNLRLGAVGFEPSREARRHALNIDARGSNANVQVGSPGASIAIGRDQVVRSDVDVSALIAALDDAAKQVKNANIAVEPRIDLLDQLDHARRIAASSDLDEGLLRRSVGRLVPALTSALTHSDGSGIAASFLKIDAADADH